VSDNDNVTVQSRESLPADGTGIALASLGVLAFSMTFPATKLALVSLDPWFIAFGRAAVAAVLAAVVLRTLGTRRPRGREWLRLLVVAAGVVLGFPALSTLALHATSASHGAVVIAILPAATAAAGVLRSHESPTRAFWVAAGAGALLVTIYAVSRAGGRLGLGDAYLLIAVLGCAVGYAEGGLLARTLGARQTICWALIISAPVTLPVALLHAPGHVPGGRAIAGFAYVSLGSALLGFFAWYAGLARAGVAKASQMQLAQTPLTLGWSALILGEQISWSMILVALGVVACIAVTQRARIADRRTLERRGTMPHVPDGERPPTTGAIARAGASSLR
jgi:drug/metabolite transporter (DMT)-like permease